MNRNNNRDSELWHWQLFQYSSEHGGCFGWDQLEMWWYIDVDDGRALSLGRFWKSFSAFQVLTEAESAKSRTFSTMILLWWNTQHSQNGHIKHKQCKNISSISNWGRQCWLLIKGAILTIAEIIVFFLTNSICSFPCQPPLHWRSTPISQIKVLKVNTTIEWSFNG